MITLSDISVIDADFIPSEIFPSFPRLHIWYTSSGYEDQQDDICGAGFLSWLCEVQGHCYERLRDYWYATRPADRNRDVASYLVHWTRSLMKMRLS